MTEQLTTPENDHFESEGSKTAKELTQLDRVQAASQVEMSTDKDELKAAEQYHLQAAREADKAGDQHAVADHHFEYLANQAQLDALAERDEHTA